MCIAFDDGVDFEVEVVGDYEGGLLSAVIADDDFADLDVVAGKRDEIGRASCRERV